MVTYMEYIPNKMKLKICLAILFLFCMFDGVSAQADECWRTCRESDIPRTCVYNFTIEYYLTLSKACHDCPFNQTHCDRPHCVSGDGQRRAVIAINRQIPAPTIRVCRFDTVIVNVWNELASGEATSLHWHGQHMRDNPYMDGAGLLTQCPITMKSKFQYDFIAETPGTHMYHGHTGFHVNDGLYGALIVDVPNSANPHSNLYDHNCLTPSGACEFTILLADFYNKLGVEMFSIFSHHSPPEAFGWFQPEAMSSLLNGKNSRYPVQQSSGGGTAYTPYEVFHVDRNKKYRVRVISAASQMVVFKLSVDGHQLQVIAADGKDVEATFVDVIGIYPGERYDFVLHTTNPVDNYWIKAHQITNWDNSKPHSFAILRYLGAPAADPLEDPDEDRRGMFLNPVLSSNPRPHYEHGPPYDILPHELNNIILEDFTDEVVDRVYYLATDFYANDNSRFNHPIYYPVQELTGHMKHYTPNINNITFIAPPSPPLSQPGDVDPNALCSGASIDQQACYENACRCVHVEAIPLGSTVEVVWVYEGVALNDPGHPMHIHGYNFRLVAMDKLGNFTSVATVREMNEQGQINKKLVGASYRDTVNLYDGGYMVIRFTADNPGYWFFHCHSILHIEEGQVMVFKVGEEADFPSPPANFPTCGHFPKGQ